MSGCDAGKEGKRLGMESDMNGKRVRIEEN